MLTSCINDRPDDNGTDDVPMEQDVLSETIRVLVPTRGIEETLKEAVENSYLDIDVEFIYATYSGSSTNKRMELEQYIDEMDIDLVYPWNYYPLWAEAGLLYPLDHFIQESSFHAGELHPAILERYRINGEIYGLSPYFHTSVLAYNKDIFDQIGMDYPQDHMTWEEVFQLARKVKAYNPEWYGIEIMLIHVFLHHVGVTNNIGYFYEADHGVEFKIETEEWREIWEMVDRLFKEEVVYIPPYISENLESVFFEGNAGLSFGPGPGLIYHLENDARFSWDIVTEPVHPAHRNEALSVDYAIDLISISSSSRKVDMAWEVLNSINSSAYSERLSLSDDFLPLTRTAHINTNQEFNVRAFYTLSNGLIHYKDVYTNMPTLFDTDKFEDALSREFDHVVRRDKDVSEALRSLQSIGNELIREAKEEEMERSMNDSEEN